MPHSRLLVRLPNWIGDVIMCLPALELLQSQGITPILFGKPWIHDLLESLGLPLYTWPQTPSKIFGLLRQFPESSILLYPNSFSSAFYARLAGKNPIGFIGDGRKYLLTQPVKKPEFIYEADVFYHLTQTYLSTQAQSQTTEKISIIPTLSIHHSRLEEARALLRHHHVPLNFMILCPFAHGLNREKQPKKWPHWQELALALPPKSYIICPGPTELEEAYQRFPQAIILEGIPLNIYAALCQLARVVIANDSGPMHIAAAVGSHTIALFGATDPKRAAPKNVTVLGKWQGWPTLDQVLTALSPHKKCTIAHILID